MPGRSFCASLLAAALAVTPPPAVAETPCSRCDRVIELDASQWNCLMSRLPEFRESKTRLLFFTLTEDSCAGGARSDTVRSSGTNLPSVARSAEAPRLYRLTVDQVTCLAERAAEIQPADGVFKFDFSAACGGSR